MPVARYFVWSFLTWCFKFSAPSSPLCNRFGSSEPPNSAFHKISDSTGTNHIRPQNPSPSSNLLFKSTRIGCDADLPSRKNINSRTQWNRNGEFSGNRNFPLNLECSKLIESVKLLLPQPPSPALRRWCRRVFGFFLLDETHLWKTSPVEKRENWHRGGEGWLGICVCMYLSLERKSSF